MSKQLPIVSGEASSKGESARLLIICPLADIYSGVGNFGAPPLGPWRLASFLRHNGQHVDVWDCNVSAGLQIPMLDASATRDRAEVLAEAFVAGIEADLDLSSYGWIGFSILSDTLPMTLGVIELVRKKYPAAKLVGGNHEATVNLNDCVGKSHLDGVILGDAEDAMLALLQGTPPSSVPGVLWRNFNPKPPRERFEEWNKAIRWSEIPYQGYWERTRSLYDFDKMSEEERLSKDYEIRTVRIHSLVACELSCTYSVTGDTRVYTEDGPVEIAALIKGEGQILECPHGVQTVAYEVNRSVATPRGRALATVVVDEGERPVLRVSTEGGFSIKVTPEHKLLRAVDDDVQWCRADALTEGDFVVIRRPDHVWATSYFELRHPVIDEKKYSRRGGGRPRHRLPRVLDEKLAWLVGYIVGDGCIPSDGRPTVGFIVSPDLEAKQSEIVRDLFGLDLKTTRCTNTDKVRNGWIYSRLVRELIIQSVGVDPADKLKIPTSLWKSPKTVMSAFLDGLFAADAYVSEKSEYLVTVSERLAADVADALMMIGKGCADVHRIESREGGYSDRGSYRVSVFKQDRIPSSKSVYCSAYSGNWYWRSLKKESAHNNGCVGIRRSTLRESGLHHTLDRDGWYYMRVKRIEKCSSERIYDIAVPSEEAFVANGFIAHNCSVANTRRIASGSTKPSIVNLSTSALEETLLAVKRQVPGMMTIYDSSDEAWLGRGRAHEYLSVLERIRPVMDEGLPRGCRYLIQCRTNDLDEEIIRRAGAVGVRHLTIGVESPVEQVRKDIRKPQREDLIRNVIRWGTQYGVDMYCLFIMFLPTITLEQLYEAVDNWRIYIDLGATVSVEPFCMSYLGTAMHDDPTFMTEHVGYDIPFSGGKKLKWATLIWPYDRRVCAILQWFRANVDAYIEEARKKLGHRHTFKGTTGKITVDCLADALRLYEQGKIPPWDPSLEGKRSAVYQDYGDQMSGSEIASAVRRNTTGTRFNSTHGLLDTNAGIPGRIKDPALPHEMVGSASDSKADSEDKT